MFIKNPDKPNIFLERCDKPSNYDVDECAEYVYMRELDDLKKRRKDYPVTLCYLPLEWMAKVLLPPPGMDG